MKRTSAFDETLAQGLAPDGGLYVSVESSRFAAGIWGTWWSLADTGAHMRAPLVEGVVTSGDTWADVAAALHWLTRIQVAVLFPKGLVSPTQERQLTCWRGNVRLFSVRGTFDDRQCLVKHVFLAPQWQEERVLSSANSINLGQLVPQAVYYAAVGLAVWARMRQGYEDLGQIWCPPTATAAQTYARLPHERCGSGRWVLVSTAHPAKFREIAGPLLGREVPMAESLAKLLAWPTVRTAIETDLDSLRDALREDGTEDA